jgi:hypothetical protein
MTGGTALPADVNPPPAPSADDHPSGTGQPGAPGSPQDRQPAGKLPGLPRLFFAERDLDPQAFGQDNDGPAGQDAPGSGQPGQPAQPSRYGTPAQSAGLGLRGQQQGSWQAGQGVARGQADQNFGARRTGPGQPSQRPARQGRTRPPERELRQRGIACLVFGVMSLIAILFGFGPDPRRGIYLVIFSSLVGIAAIVIGVSAIAKSRRAGSYRPRGVIGGIGLGALATVVSLMFGVLYLAYPNQMRTYVNCVGQAQTASQKKACLNQLEKSIRASLPSRGQG